MTRNFSAYNFVVLLIFIQTLVYGQEKEEQVIENQTWETSVETVSHDTLDGAVFIRGEIIIPESKENIWNVLTDYENLKNFIPNIIESSIILNNGSQKTIKQKGKSKFLFFSKTVEITLDIEEQKPDQIHFKLKEGPFHIYNGNWLLKRSDNGYTQLIYNAIAKPDFFLPKFIMKRVLKKNFRESLEAIRSETKRRHKSKKID